MLAISVVDRSHKKGGGNRGILATLIVLRGQTCTFAFRSWDIQWSGINAISVRRLHTRADALRCKLGESSTAALVTAFQHSGAYTAVATALKQYGCVVENDCKYCYAQS